jgi:hypothetical protein
MRESTTASVRHDGAGSTKEMQSNQQCAAPKSRGKRSAMLAMMMMLLLPSVAAQAQTPDAPPPAEPPPAAPPPAEMPPPPPPPAVAAPSAVEAAPKPPTNTETMAATRPEVLPPIDVGAWLRVGGAFQGKDQSKLNDFHFDHAYVELHAGGKIHKKVGVTLNLNADMLNFGGAPATASAADQIGSAVAVEDAIISFDFEDEFHLWAGHLLVPVDRSNASGPFFMIPWNYPGFFAGAAAPKEGPSGRNNGAVVWGDIAGGRLTYLAGVFDNANIGTSPLFSGRLRLALLDPEPGFWGNGSYFGDKDLLSIGIGGQFQKHGSSSALTDKNWGEFNADVLFEKKIPGGGWGTVEGAYYHYNVLDGGISDSLYALLAYASPTVGVGNIQPMVRYQWEKVKAGSGTNPWNLDVGLAYLIKGPALRVIANYGHTKLGTDTTANSIQLGAQAIFF